MKKKKGYIYIFFFFLCQHQYEKSPWGTVLIELDGYWCLSLELLLCPGFALSMCVTYIQEQQWKVVGRKGRKGHTQQPRHKSPYGYKALQRFGFGVCFSCCVSKKHVVLLTKCHSQVSSAYLGKRTLAGAPSSLISHKCDKAILL